MIRTASLCISLLCSSVWADRASSQQISNVQDLWKHCAERTGSKDFEVCMVILRGSMAFAMMKESGVQVCVKNGPPLETVGSRIGQMGRAGMLDDYATLEPEPIVFAIFEAAYPCS